jgi:hypothetical protein
MHRNPGRPSGGGDPATTDRVYDDREREFLAACERYRAEKKRAFLLATDYLRILISLGYAPPLAGSPPESNAEAVV